MAVVKVTVDKYLGSLFRVDEPVRVASWSGGEKCSSSENAGGVKRIK